MSFIRLSSFTPTNILKFLGWLCLGITLFIVFVLRGFYFYSQSQLSDIALYKAFQDTFTRRESGMYQYGQHGNDTLHYIDLGHENETAENTKTIFLIHGAPGSITDRKALLGQEELQTGYRFVIVDRLGYGLSDRRSVETDIGVHAKIYGVLLQYLNLKDVIVLGHSYGGPIALLMQRDNPDKIGGSIIVSGAVDPDLEKVFSISYLVKYKPLKYIIGPVLRVSNDEKLSHALSLEKNMINLGDIQTSTIIIHGTEDSLVPYENIQFLLDRISPDLTTLIPVPGADHPIHFTHPGAIAKALIDNF